MTASRCRPSLDEFVDLAREYSVVPVWREVLADLETPLSAFAKLVGDREGFLLESVEHAERWGRFSFLGRDPARTFVTRGRNVTWVRGDAPPDVPSDAGTLAALEGLLDRYRSRELGLRRASLWHSDGQQDAGEQPPNCGTGVVLRHQGCTTLRKWEIHPARSG